MNRVWRVGALVLMVALVLGLVTEFSGPAREAERLAFAPRSVEGVRAQQPTEPIPPQVIRPQGPALPAAPRTRVWLDALALSQGLRVVVDKALKSPADGGLLAALDAFAECFGDEPGARHLPKGLLRVDPQQGQAEALLRARCDLDADEKDRMLQAAMSAGADPLRADPWMARSLQVLAGGRRLPDREQLAADLLRARDPVAGFLLFGLAEDGDAGPLRFEGTVYADPDEQRLLLDAWLAARCAWGMPCGPESITALRLCRDRGWCGLGVPEALRVGYAGDRVLGQRFEALLARLQQALAGDSIRPFVPRGV